MSFEGVLEDVRKYKPFKVDEIFSISKTLEKNENTQHFVKQVWLACQLFNSLGFSSSIINELRSLPPNFDDEHPFFGVCVEFCGDNFIFSVPEDANLEFLVSEAENRILKYTGSRVRQQELRFWNEPLEKWDTQLVKDLHGAKLNDTENLLTFELIDCSKYFLLEKRDVDVIYCHVVWEKAQVTAKMMSNQTVDDLLLEAQKLIRRKTNIELDPNCEGLQIYRSSCKTPTDRFTDLGSLQPGDDLKKQIGPRSLGFVVTIGKTQTPNTFEMPSLADLSSDIKDGYYIHIVWNMSQLDFKINKGASCLEALQRARDLFESKRNMKLCVEDAWDNLFYQGKHVEDTRIQELPDITLNDPLKPIHFAIDMNSHVIDAKSPENMRRQISDSQNEFISEMGKRSLAEPEFYCHVFWEKHFISVKLSINCTCTELLEKAKELLEAKKKADLDVKDALTRLTFKGCKIEDPRTKLTHLLCDIPEVQLLEKPYTLHFSVLDDPNAPKQNSVDKQCYLCSLVWRKDGKDEEFIVFKLPKNATCSDILTKLVEKRKEFNPKLAERCLWLDHTRITNFETTKISDLKGAQLVDCDNTESTDSSKSLHFLIDPDKDDMSKNGGARDIKPKKSRGLFEKAVAIVAAETEVDVYDNSAETPKPQKFEEDSNLTNNEIDRLSRILNSTYEILSSETPPKTKKSTNGPKEAIEMDDIPDGNSKSPDIAPHETPAKKKKKKKKKKKGSKKQKKEVAI